MNLVLYSYINLFYLEKCKIGILLVPFFYIYANISFFLLLLNMYICMYIKIAISEGSC